MADPNWEKRLHPKAELIWVSNSSRMRPFYSPKQQAMKNYGRELVYNDELTAS
jgi:hypothetical protein